MCDGQGSDDNKVEDAYVLGHRLLTFLSTALPKHPEYHTSLDQRTRCVTETIYIRTQLKKFALRIDEEQLNRFMEHDYEPPATDDEDEDEPDSLVSQQNEEAKNLPQKQHQQEWENFEGWSICRPNLIDTDESSYDEHEESTLANSAEQAISYEECYGYADPELDNVSIDSSSTTTSDSNSVELTLDFRASASPAHFDVEEPELDDAVPVNDDDEPSPVGSEFQFVSSFLRKVAREDVCYETDSEAADSWAQADPVPRTRNDEARKTLGEILSRHTELVTAMNLEISDAAASFPPPPLNDSPKKA